MKSDKEYIDLDNNPISLSELDAAERQLVARLRRQARTKPDWDAFDNFWTHAVPEFYQACASNASPSWARPFGA